MKVTLMNQNTKVLSAELESDNTFSKIYEYYDINYAPLPIFNVYNDSSKSNLKELNHWFQGRGIPSTDRHMKNYGVIRNIKTLKWERVTPIFDTGNSLQTDQVIYDVNFYNSPYKFFPSHTMTIKDLLKYIQIEKYDLNKLDGLVDELKDVLDEYGDLIELSDARYENTLEGFKNRINNLQKYFEI